MQRRVMASFEEKLKKIVVLKSYAKANLQTLHPDLKDMLVKQVKNTKRINWVANKGTYTKWKLNQFVPLIEESRIFKLELMKNYQRSIIKNIEHIKFTDLQFLNLQENWITNIQAIVYLDAPQLRWLDLKNNEISEMRAFRKMTSPSFKSLKINLSQFIINFTQLNNYNRHAPTIARELILNHTGNVFSERIKTIFNRRKIFYPVDKEKAKKGNRGDSDEE